MVDGRGRRIRTQTLVLLVAAYLMAVGCAGASRAATAVGAPSQPSPQAKMICSSESQNEVSGALGVKPSRAASRWVSPLYSCQYVFDVGQIVLSVHEFADTSATTAGFDGLSQQLGKRSVIGGLGQGAFDTRDDSVVVRKDAKILLVDVSGMPTRFGTPAVTRSEAAVRIAIVIMGCWTGV